MSYQQIYNRALIFDGSHALHRNLSVPNNWDMKTSTGIRTGGIFGVLRTIVKELKDYNYYPIVVFDGGLSKRRLDIYPNYKRTLDKQQLNESVEEKTEEQLIDEEFRREYNSQRETLKQLLPLFNIPVICLDGWEGDDIIYVLTKLCKDSIVVSDDKDLLQLIRDDETGRCRVRRAMREEFWDLNHLKENNVDIKEYISCKSIVGDGSDNIPSACYQVGEKTAPGLYQLYESIKLNNLNFPSTEEELNSICKKLNLPKRKAYINFNENQFLTNLLLTDLSLVDNDITQDIIDNVNNTLQVVINNLDPNNKETINIFMNNCEIRTFDSKYLYDRCYKLRDVLFNDTTMSEIDVPKGRLF